MVAHGLWNAVRMLLHVACNELQPKKTEHAALYTCNEMGLSTEKFLPGHATDMRSMLRRHGWDAGHAQDDRARNAAGHPGGCWATQSQPWQGPPKADWRQQQNAGTAGACLPMTSAITQISI